MCCTYSLWDLYTSLDGSFTLLMFFFLHFSGKTKRGELSIFPRSFIVLSHCLHMMPRQKAAPGSENANVKVRRRDLELSKIGITSCCNWFCVLVQKTELWVPGSTRNPETYILKDQVLDQYHLIGRINIP